MSAFRLFVLAWTARPALIFGGIAHLNLLLLLLRPVLPPGTRYIVRQNGSPPSMFAATCPRIARSLFRIAYCRADRIICQTEAMAQDLKSALDLQDTNISVLPNPVDIEVIRRCAHASQYTWRSEGPNLLAVGRLSPEKGFDLLLDAFAAICARFPRAELIIAGTGVCEENLKRQAVSLGISSRVQFVGHVPSPAAYFAGATLFVLPSRDEGLPNALLEAAAAGLPIVASPASRGLVDLLHNKEGVWIAAGVSAQDLEQALANALGTPNVGARFRHSWIQHFGLPAAIQSYQSVIDRVLCGDNP